MLSIVSVAPAWRLSVCAVAASFAGFHAEHVRSDYRPRNTRKASRLSSINKARTRKRRVASRSWMFCYGRHFQANYAVKKRESKFEPIGTPENRSRRIRFLPSLGGQFSRVHTANRGIRHSGDNRARVSFSIAIQSVAAP